MSELPFFQSIEVDISENASDGASDSVNVGGYLAGPVVPVSVLCPANLRGVDRVRVQVSQDNTTFYDIFVDGAIVPLALTINTVLMVPSAIQAAVMGYAYMRLLTTDASDVAEEPSADISFVVRFALGETVPGVAGSGGVAALGAVTQGTSPWVVGGNVAHDSPVSGNPVRVAGKATSTTAAVAVTAGDVVDAGYDPYGRALAAAGGIDGTAGADSQTAIWIPFVGGTQGLSVRPVINANYLFNGTSWDRQRNNFEASVLASAARTATTNSSDLTNYSGRGVMVTINVTVEGAATLSLKVQGKDSVSGNYYDIVDFGVVYTAATEAPTITKTASLYPGNITADHIGIAAGVNGTIAKAGVLPRVWRVVVTPADATTTTYSVSAAVIV